VGAVIEFVRPRGRLRLRERSPTPALLLPSGWLSAGSVGGDHNWLLLLVVLGWGSIDIDILGDPPI